jgi:hypothetical protein
MNSKVWIINLALAGLLLFSGSRVVDLWREQPRLPGGSGSSKARDYQPPRAKGRQELQKERAYGLIVSQSLFSPERKEYVPEEPEKEDAAEKEKGVRISGKRVVLYGVVVAGGSKRALINNPQGKLGEDRHQWIEEGRTYENLKVLSIEPDKILLDDGREEHEILLSRKKGNESGRGSEKPAGPTVVSGGSDEKPKPIKAKTIDSSSGQEKEATRPQKKKDASESEEAKYKIVDTPFGKIRQRIE